MIKQANKLASVLCDIEYDRLGAKEDRNKIAMEEEDHRKPFGRVMNREIT